MDERPSKRSRLANTLRRKLSLKSSNTGNGAVNGSGQTSSNAARRVSGIDIFNPLSFSSFRSLSRATTSAGPKRIRIAVIGDSAAGKTTMLKYVANLLFAVAVGANNVVTAVFIPECTSPQKSLLIAVTTTSPWRSMDIPLF